MTDAMILSYARTAWARSVTGGFNLAHPVSFAADPVRAAVERSGVSPEEIADSVIGCANPEGATAHNLGRMVALSSGLGVETPGMTVSRFCASGLNALAISAQRVMTGECDVLLAGGVESISLVQRFMNTRNGFDPRLLRDEPDLYMSMLDTAETVATRYGISREQQDEYSYQSQSRTAKALSDGLFAQEIIPLSVEALELGPKPTQFTKDQRVVDADECPRPETTLDGLSALKSVTGPNGTITAGNATPFADGAAAMIVGTREKAVEHNADALGRVVGFAVAGVRPDEMGIGPIPAVRQLLGRHNLTVQDIDLWELNEAYASQVLYCQQELGIPYELLNVNGGSIALGHPYGATGIRMAGHALLEARRRQVRRVVVTMCVGGGQGAAMLLEAEW